jgi:hypothetical protein
MVSTSTEVTPAGTVHVVVCLNVLTIDAGTLLTLYKPALNSSCTSLKEKMPLGTSVAKLGVRFLPTKPALPLAILEYYLV